MSDLIRRNDAIKALHEEWDGGWLEVTGEWIADNCEAVLNRLPSAEITADDVLEYCRPRLLTIVAEEALPSADRPQGEWKDVPPNAWEFNGIIQWHECSACKYRSMFISNYCPHCGTRMKGTEDEKVEVPFERSRR